MWPVSTSSTAACYLGIREIRGRSVRARPVSLPNYMLQDCYRMRGPATRFFAGRKTRCLRCPVDAATNRRYGDTVLISGGPAKHESSFHDHPCSGAGRTAEQGVAPG